jgi:hypothetical protein
MDAHHEMNRRKTVVKRIIIMALGVLLALALATPMALAQVGQGAKASGTAAELAAAWWQWATSNPVDSNPLIGPNDDHPVYSEEQCDGTPVSPTQGKTWFLAGTGDGSKVVRTCTMPVGTHLFFPVVNIVGFPFPANPLETKESERAAAIARMDAVLGARDFFSLVTVDGKMVKSNRIGRATYSLGTGPYFTLTLPKDNVFGQPAGEYEATADGLWVTLPPLPPGVHTIHFEASAPSVGVSQNNTYILTVVNKGKKPAP